MQNIIFEFSELTSLYEVTICIFCGLLISVCLKYCKQKWSETYHNTISFLLLPAIAYVITSVITNNIALSLGMVGALSIVRFRHPVKNALELIMYFDLITIGISAGVNVKYTILITMITIFILILVYFYYFKINFKNQKISSAYYEGLEGTFLEIESKINIDDFLDNSRLVEVYANKAENNFTYRLFFSKFEDAKKFYKEKINNSEIDSIKLMNE